MTLLVIGDIDWTVIILACISGFFGLVTLLINKKINKIAKDVNGKITALLQSKDQTSVAKQSASLATGKLEGIAAMNPDNPALLELSKEANTPVPEKGAVLDVNIVDQHKPVEVTQKPDDKK